MALVTNTGALSAAAQRLSEAACSAFEDILVDVLRPGPREAASVVAADHVQRRVVDGRVFRENARHQRLALRLLVVGGVFGHPVARLVEHQGRRVRPVGDRRHERSVACQK